MLQGSYTWSHSIDNQSDPLVGDFFNLTFTSIQTGETSGQRSTFSEQFNPNSDRGNSDFDQRQNLVLFSYWNLPSLFAASKPGIVLRDWTIAGLAAFRSGLPFSVYGPSTGSLMNNRADLLNPAQAVFTNPAPVAGGVQLLNPAAFGPAAQGTLGNLGRNAFTGPGFYSLDLSLARAFHLPWLGESGRRQSRCSVERPNIRCRNLRPARIRLRLPRRESVERDAAPDPAQLESGILIVVRNPPFSR